MDRIELTTFTDPMMGLSYESEPFFRGLQTHFGEKIHFRYVMAGLVHDVRQFMIADDFAEGEERALCRYQRRLAHIYQSEEYISGMPINLTADNLRLFTPENLSSLPLNLAYKAAQLATPCRADAFLYRLRFALIAECRPLGEWQAVRQVADEADIDLAEFDRHIDNGNANAALAQDFAEWQSLGLFSLPSYRLTYQGKSLILKGVINFDGFMDAIAKLTDHAVQPTLPEISQVAVANLLKSHPLMSLVELQHAFDLTSPEQAETIIRPLIEQEKVHVFSVGKGHFFQTA